MLSVTFPFLQDVPGVLHPLWEGAAPDPPHGAGEEGARRHQ